MEHITQKSQNIEIRIFFILRKKLLHQKHILVVCIFQSIG